MRTSWPRSSTPESEPVHFALSRGNDPLRRRALNGGRLLITSGFGTGGLRDPLRRPLAAWHGFHLIAMDPRYAHWDDESDAYVVHWASRLWPEEATERMPASVPWPGGVRAATRRTHSWSASPTPAATRTFRLSEITYADPGQQQNCRGGLASWVWI